MNNFSDNLPACYVYAVILVCCLAGFVWRFQEAGFYMLYLL